MLPTPVTSGPTPVFEIRNLHKAFGNNVLFRGANLTVNTGETLAIIGESGSGKSVLLKMMIGLEEPDDGTISFRGRDVFSMDQTALDGLRQEIGYMFQNDALFDSMSVLDNIGFGMRERHRSSDEKILERGRECLMMVGLGEDVLPKFPSELSGGMRKRVGIARAVAMRPKVLMYDEPTQGLDPQSITRVADMIVALQRELDATSVIVTHDMRTAFTAADRIALLHDGRFEHIGTPWEFIESRDEAVVEFISDALEEIEDLEAMRDEARSIGLDELAAAPE